MIKRIIVILCIVTLMFTVEIQAYDKLELPEYNNEERVTRVTNLEKRWNNWFDYQMGSGSIYNIYNIVQFAGAEPYWRLGKNNNYYAIYKIEDKGIHYLILDFSTPSKNLGGAWYVSKIPSKELFQKYVHPGTSMEVVNLIDPDTYDIFVMLGKDWGITEHRFADGNGYDLTFEKDTRGNWVVGHMQYRNDPYYIAKNLLDIDYELIKNDNPNEEAEFLEKLKKLEGIPTDQDKYKKPAKVKIKSVKRIKKKNIIVKYKKAKNAKKYQIQYATNKKFKKAKIKTTKKRSFIIKKLFKNKTYYIRVRGQNGTKKGLWSNIKKVKKVKNQVVSYDIKKGGSKHD